jgi:hypothetical protein
MALSGVLSLFDSYSRQARLYPSLLLILPIPVVVIAAQPDLLTSRSTGAMVGLLATCGVLYLMTSVVRSLGKAIEPHLLVKWNGWPTTEILRHSGPLNTYTRRRYHKYLEEHVPDCHMPTAADELNNLAQADRHYDSAIIWLKELARGNDFPLVEKENAQYGFRRNLLGARPIGILISLGCTAYCAASLVWTSSHFHGSIHFIVTAAVTLANSEPWLSTAMIGSLISALWWIFFVNRSWVHEAGLQYARSLLAVCDKT